MRRRTMLFLPGNNPNMIVNGGMLGSDSIIFDLEDAVAPDQKDAARILVRSALTHMQFGSVEIIVRINSLDTPYWEEDLEAILPLNPDIIMPTKVSGPEYIHTLEEKMLQIEQNQKLSRKARLIPLLETAMGIEQAYEIAKSSPRIAALYLGAEDLSADLRCRRTKKGREILYARQRLVCAARAAGVEAYDTPFTAIHDLKGLKKDALLAKALGFTGKAVINPRHVEIVNQVFSPTQDEILHAKRVLHAITEAEKSGKGAVSLDGKMIDAPVVQRARLVLEAASQSTEVLS